MDVKTHAQIDCGKACGRKPMCGVRDRKRRRETEFSTQALATCAGDAEATSSALKRGSTDSNVRETMLNLRQRPTL
jgi:hypothetical protein